jgi:hypothetical protein
MYSINNSSDDLKYKIYLSVKTKPAPIITIDCGLYKPYNGEMQKKKN